MTLGRLQALQEQWQLYPPITVMFEAYIRAKAGGKIPPPTRKKKKGNTDNDPNTYSGERLARFFKALPNGTWAG